MRIACIATSRVPSRTANSIQVMKVCQALGELGHQVRLWLPGQPAVTDEGGLVAHYGLRTVVPISWLPSFNWGRHYDFCARAAVAGRRWRADLFYVWPLPAAALASSFNWPTVLEVHDHPTGRLGPAVFRQFLRGRGPRRLLITTAALRDWLEEHYRVDLRHPLAVLSPNGVDLERYKDLPSPQEARRGLGLEQRLTAVYTGHLYAGRGIGLILELARMNPNMGFVFAGGEPESVDRWRRQAQASGLGNAVFLGFVPNDRLPLIQAAGDILLMPHERRVLDSGGGDIADFTNPMKAFEYLAAGRPILASDLPVLREILNPSNAVLLPPDDPAAWDRALGALEADPARRRRLAQRAAEEALRHSWTARAERALEGLSSDVG